MHMTDEATSTAIRRSGNRSGHYDTTEVRWFASGRLPSGLVEQFSDMPGSASIEIRTDTYRVNASHGVGLKRRNSGPLELKIRQTRTGHLRFGGAIDSPIEDWRKIVGLNHPVFQDAGSWQWSDVEKMVLTRTYRLVDADRVGLVTQSQEALGCEVELAAVTVGDLEAWTFALEAWGPVRERRRLLRLVLAAHTLEMPFPAPDVASLKHAMGYPEWLATIAVGRS